jgi:hypothetical protein
MLTLNNLIFVILVSIIIADNFLCQGETVAVNVFGQLELEIWKIGVPAGIKFLSTSDI